MWLFSAYTDAKLLPQTHVCFSELLFLLLPQPSSHILPLTLSQLLCCTCPPQLGLSLPFAVYTPYHVSMGLVH